MEKEIKESVQRTKITHEFYCDECGASLGQSEEHDDGYYEKIGDEEWSFYIRSAGWFHKRGNYCPACRRKVEQSIIDALLKLGFHSGDY